MGLGLAGAPTQATGSAVAAVAEDEHSMLLSGDDSRSSAKASKGTVLHFVITWSIEVHLVPLLFGK